MATFNINQISEQVPLIKKIFTEKSRRQWLMEQTGNNIPTQSGIMNTVKAVHWRQMVLGEFYFFSYRPKHAKTLDYYDTFPLVIPRLSRTRDNNYMEGYNLHYLSVATRLLLLEREFHFNQEIFEPMRKKIITEGIRKQIYKKSWQSVCNRKYITKNIINNGNLYQLTNKADLPYYFGVPYEAFKKIARDLIHKENQKLINI